MVRWGRVGGRAQRTRSWRGPPAGCAALALALGWTVVGPGPSFAGARATGDAVPVPRLVWERSPVGAPGAGNLGAIATDGKRFVIGGLVSGLPAGALPIWTSADGMTWKQATLRAGSFPAQTLVSDIVWDGARFLAFAEPRVASEVVVYSSTDGRSWKPAPVRGIPTTSGFDPNEATRAPGGVLLLVANPSEQTYSVWRHKGATWRSLGPVPASPRNGADPVKIAPKPHARGMTAVGSQDGNQAAAWTTPDGKSWAAASVTGVEPGRFSEINDVVALPSRLVAVGALNGPNDTEIGAAWTSTDGKSWTDAGADAFATAGGNAQGIDHAVANGSGVLGAGHDGGKLALWTSKQGTAWSRVPDQPAFDIGSAAQVSGVAVAHGRVVTLVRNRQFNGQGFDLVGLEIVTGAPPRAKTDKG